MAFAISPFFRLAVIIVAALAAPAAAQDKGTTPVGASGLPLPRYASLASGDVNVRTGPSIDNPIRWAYTRAGLPVRIVEESELWRKIEDPDGETGWAHSSVLSVQRTVMIQGPEVQDMHRKADADGRVVARLEPGVIGRFENCLHDWCHIVVAGEDGWVARAALWGVGSND